MNKQLGVLISVGVGFTLISLATSVSHSCNGTVDFSILYEDGRIKDVRVDLGADKVSDNETNTPISLQGLRFSQEGENGIRIDNERHHIQLIPGGTSGSYVVHLFDYEAEVPVWTTINVYCQPLGLAYIQPFPNRDEIVGYCAVNTTYKGSITCVPYFKLRFTNNQWIDVTSPGSCSEALSSTNITNIVILQADSVYEVDETRMYFAERGTNRLQEISLSLGQQQGSYEVDALLKIDYLVPAVNNTSFRVVCRIENSSSLYHKSFIWDFNSDQNTAGFIDGYVVTESIAFDSYYFDYLVTFSTNRDMIIHIMKDGKSDYYPLLSTLDDPIQCQDLATPVTHYLICLAKNGLHPLLINITDSEVTNQLIGQSKKITRMEILTENLFYLLNNQQEFLIYVITTTVIHVGTYTVRPDVNFIITDASSNVNCTVEENVDQSSNTDKPRSNLVAILVPTITVGLIIVMAVLIAAVAVYLRRGIVNERMKPDVNGDHILNDMNNYVPIDTSINDDDTTDNVTNPTFEDRDTGQRTAEDLPTNSVEACEETSGSNQDRMLVTTSTYQHFPNLDPTTATRRANESNSETIPVEVHSDQCIDPRECAEDIIPPTAEREDPIGGGDTHK